MIRRQAIEAIQDAANYAAAKHGVVRTPANSDMPDLQKLAILMEEVGELAHELTYDSDALLKNKRKELAQIAAMAGMWLDSLEGA